MGDPLHTVPASNRTCMPNQPQERFFFGDELIPTFVSALPLLRSLLLGGDGAQGLPANVLGVRGGGEGEGGQAKEAPSADPPPWAEGAPMAEQQQQGTTAGSTGASCSSRRLLVCYADEVGGWGVLMAPSLSPKTRSRLYLLYPTSSLTGF